MISFVLFPQTSQPSMNFDIHEYFGFDQNWSIVDCMILVSLTIPPCRGVHDHIGIACVMCRERSF